MKRTFKITVEKDGGVELIDEDKGVVVMSTQVWLATKPWRIDDFMEQIRVVIDNSYHDLRQPTEP